MFKGDVYGFSSTSDIYFMYASLCVVTRSYKPYVYAKFHFGYIF
jgi:hypothetical protein